MADEAVPTKDEVRRRIIAARKALERVVMRVPADCLEVAGADGWSVKDHLAHIAAWERSLMNLLQKLPRHTALDVSEEEFRERDTDYVNERARASREGWHLAQVLTDFQSVHDDLLDVLDRLSEEDLARPFSYFQPGEPRDDGDAAVVGWIAGDTYEHYDEHRVLIEALVGSA
jgi:uncharacterized protein (DUF849 family)